MSMYQPMSPNVSSAKYNSAWLFILYFKWLNDIIHSNTFYHWSHSIPFWCHSTWFSIGLPITTSIPRHHHYDAYSLTILFWPVFIHYSTYVAILTKYKCREIQIYPNASIHSIPFYRCHPLFYLEFYSLPIHKCNAWLQMQIQTSQIYSILIFIQSKWLCVNHSILHSLPDHWNANATYLPFYHFDWPTCSTWWFNVFK